MSSNMQTIHQTIHPSTTVEFSLECRFYGQDENNLVVAGANQLYIYRIQAKLLEFVQSFELYGSIASMKKIFLGKKRDGSIRDSLVLSFDDAKLSIIEYDPETHDLKTISMHYFEDGRIAHYNTPPIVRVDPDERCISMLIYGEEVVIIPIYKDDGEDLDRELYESTTVPLSPILPSYKLDLSEERCKCKIQNIADIQFLDNYNDPTLVILYEPIKTWSGRIAARQDTFSIVALSLNVHQRLQPIIWTVNNLPYDSLRIIPVPKPIAGLLVVGSNELIYLNQSVPAFGMTFNCFTKESSSFPMNNLIKSAKELQDSMDQDRNPLDDEFESELGTGSRGSSGRNSRASVTDNAEILNGCLSKDIDDEANQNGDGSPKLGSAGDCNGEADLVGYKTISLDLSKSVFLSYNKILLILKNGDVYLVTLFNDDMRSIRDFQFERIASTVQPDSLTLCDNNMIFIGSHVGDSVLAEIVGDFKTNQDDTQESDSLLSGQGGQEPTLLYEHDQIFSTSSSGRLCYGKASNVSEGLTHHEDPHVELVITTGHDINGSICVFQRTIKPSVEDTYELKSCGDLWSVRSGPERGSRLILNRDNDTMIFSTKGELVELRRDECPFEMDEPTIIAANFGAQDNFTLQVMSSGVRLISNDEIIDRIKFDRRICDACVSGAHAVVLDENNSVYHLMLQEPDTQKREAIEYHKDGKDIEMEDPDSQETTQKEPKHSLINQEIGQLPCGRIVSMTVYKDTSGIFSCDNIGDNLYDDEPTYWLCIVDDRGLLEIFSIPAFHPVYLVDNLPTAPNVLADNTKTYITDLDSSIPKTKEILMCGLGRKNKKPLLFARSDVELVVYEAYKFNQIRSSFNTSVNSDDHEYHLKIRFKKKTSLLLMTIMPDNLPIEMQPEEQLVALTSNNHMNSIDYHHHDYNSNNNYHGQQHHQSSSASSHHHRRHHHDDDDSSRSRSKRRRNSAKPLPNLKDRWLSRRRWLKEFRDIDGYNGVFLTGFKPHWFMMTDRCLLRVHPMTAEGAIYSFSKYDDNNFIYYSENRELRVAKLVKHFNYDHHWPIKKTVLKETVHFINYHVARNVYYVVTSKSVPCSKIMRVGNEPDTMKIEELVRIPGYIPPTTEQFKLKLYDPESWEEIPDCEIEFEEWEQVTCVKNVQLSSEGTTSGFKDYVAISTNYCYGEDVPNRGKIWILDFIEVIPEPDRPLTRNKIKKVYCQEQKGPVTAISHTCGLLMSAVGQKIYLWKLRDQSLDGVAFIDTQVYIHSATSIKNLILVGDICKSVTLLRYQQETRTLSMVSRDSSQLEVCSSDFIVDNETLNFVVADSEKNLIIYSHDPEHEDSFGGMRLLRKADYYLGAHVANFCRIRGRVPKYLEHDPHFGARCKRRHITMFNTIDGSIGNLFPINEESFKRFLSLEKEMTIALPHVAGLNPKAWRLVKQTRPTLASPCKGIIDGDLIYRFLSLSVKERNELTKKIGTTASKILADIQFIKDSTMYF